MEYIFWICFVSFTIFFIIKWRNFGKTNTEEISNADFHEYIEEEEDLRLLRNLGRRVDNLNMWIGGPNRDSFYNDDR